MKVDSCVSSGMPSCRWGKFRLPDGSYTEYAYRFGEIPLARSVAEALVSQRIAPYVNGLAGDERLPAGFWSWRHGDARVVAVFRGLFECGGRGARRGVEVELFALPGGAAAAPFRWLADLRHPWLAADEAGAHADTGMAAVGRLAMRVRTAARPGVPQVVVLSPGLPQVELAAAIWATTPTETRASLELAAGFVSLWQPLVELSIIRARAASVSDEVRQLRRRFGSRAVLIEGPAAQSGPRRRLRLVPLRTDPPQPPAPCQPAAPATPAQAPTPPPLPAIAQAARLARSAPAPRPRPRWHWALAGSSAAVAVAALLAVMMPSAPHPGPLAPPSPRIAVAAPSQPSRPPAVVPVGGSESPSPVPVSRDAGPLEIPLGVDVSAADPVCEGPITPPGMTRAPVASPVVVVPVVAKTARPARPPARPLKRQRRDESGGQVVTGRMAPRLSEPSEVSESAESSLGRGVQPADQPTPRSAVSRATCKEKFDRVAKACAERSFAARSWIDDYRAAGCRRPLRGQVICSPEEVRGGGS